MAVKNRAMVLMGAILLVAALAGAAGLIAETWEHQVPREHFCDISHVHTEGFGSLWNTIIEKTGIDPDTADVNQLSLDIDPDDLVGKMDISFDGKKDGTDQHYLISYRRDRHGCGWIDGLVYPPDNDSTRAFPRKNPRHILDTIGHIPFDAIGLRDQPVRVTGNYARGSLSMKTDSVRLEDEYVWSSTSLVRVESGQGREILTYSPPGLIFSGLNCTTLREGMSSCRSERSVRIFLMPPGSG